MIVNSESNIFALRVNKEQHIVIWNTYSYLLLDLGLRMWLRVPLSGMAELAPGSQNYNGCIYDITVEKLFASEALTVCQWHNIKQFPIISLSRCWL